MKDFEKVKLVAFDFDDTLFAHTEHVSESENEEVQYLLKCLSAKQNFISNNEVWGNCTTNQNFEVLFNYCKCHKIIIGLISGTSAYVCAEQKVEYVEEKYGYKLNNWCVASQTEKIPMLKALATLHNLNPEQILIVDDNYKVLTTAGDNGFQCATPIEMVNFVSTHQLN